MNYEEYNLLDFIKEIPDWEQIISSKPFNVKIKYEDNLVILNYNQIETKFCKLTEQCRGPIIDIEKKKYFCHPFNKFWNHNEERALKIDWDSAVIQEKKDGSFIKLWFNGYKNNWQWSTMSTINANNAELINPIPKESLHIEQDLKTFSDLIAWTLIQMFSDYGSPFDFWKLLNKNKTYLYEICTPYNRIVVPYKDCQLVYLATIDNETGQESIQENLLDFFPIPKEYKFNSLEDCIESTKSLPYSEEGYVVKDKYFHRNKIKSLAYLQVSHLKDNDGCLNPKRVIELIRLGETSEILSYFPEYENVFKSYEEKYNKLVYRITVDNSIIESALGHNQFNSSRKEFALWVKDNCLYPSIHFSMYDGKYENIQKAIDGLKITTVIELMKKV